LKATTPIILLILVLLPVGLLAGSGSVGKFCTPEGDWRILFSDQGLTISSKRVQGSRVLAFRASGMMEAPIGQIMEVMRRLEIVDEWMPDIREKFSLEIVSDVEVITYSTNRLPFPFSDRELILHNSLHLDRERNYIVLDMVSLNDYDYPVKKGAVRAVMKCGEMMVRPAGARKTEVALLLYVDPKGAIPAWLVNWAQRRMPYNFLKALEKKAAVTDFEVRPVFRQLLDDLAALSEK